MEDNAIYMNAELNINQLSEKVEIPARQLSYLINAFLTNGGQAIPKLIMLDNTSGDVIDTFGPRPSEATNNVNKFKAENGGLTPEFKEDLQQWYNKNKGRALENDIFDLMR